MFSGGEGDGEIDQRLACAPLERKHFDSPAVRFYIRAIHIITITTPAQQITKVLDRGREVDMVYMD